ncbi:Hypothetical protein CAP_2965 [Chondromyces apiculatus DSM 436]|uniref:Uncharacterized protein n=1 Tax=Chondromyces apiculatus DSM 436 TaxID=1192034 RepID=A0A017TA24_9BACT|nr:Hypothetical protein CAP_2965 [Chondromyces apiculatus DSM 436]
MGKRSIAGPRWRRPCTMNGHPEDERERMTPEEVASAAAI